MRGCIDREDIPRLANHYRFLAALSAPLVDGDYRLPTFSPMTNEDEVFEVIMAKLEGLLTALSAQGIYARLAPSYEDASQLAIGPDSQ